MRYAPWLTEGEALGHAGLGRVVFGAGLLVPWYRRAGVLRKMGDGRTQRKWSVSWYVSLDVLTCPLVTGDGYEMAGFEVVVRLSSVVPFAFYLQSKEGGNDDKARTGGEVWNWLRRHGSAQRKSRRTPGKGGRYRLGDNAFDGSRTCTMELEGAEGMEAPSGPLDISLVLHPRHYRSP
ncbi:hypothetical protein VUR80DRAFT_7907 [Thermomyces stellatus]